MVSVRQLGAPTISLVGTATVQPGGVLVGSHYYTLACDEPDFPNVPHDDRLSIPDRTGQAAGRLSSRWNALNQDPSGIGPGTAATCEQMLISDLLGELSLVFGDSWQTYLIHRRLTHDTPTDSYYYEARKLFTQAWLSVSRLVNE